MRMPSNLGAVWSLDPAWLWCRMWSGEEECLAERTPLLALPPTPPAPQTEARMRTWTPEDLWEAERQRARERERVGQAVPAPTGPPVQCAWYQTVEQGVCRFGGLNAWIAVAGLAGAGVLIAVQRRRR